MKILMILFADTIAIRGRPFNTLASGSEGKSY